MINRFHTTLTLFFFSHCSVACSKHAIYSSYQLQHPLTLWKQQYLSNNIFKVECLQMAREPIRRKSWDLSCEIVLHEQLWWFSLKEGNPPLVFPILVCSCGCTPFLHPSFHQDLLSAVLHNNHHWHESTNNHCREDKEKYHWHKWACNL